MSVVEKDFYIGGMTCNHCQNIIEKRLKNTKGVQSIKVNYRTSEAKITYDNEAIFFEEIEAIIVDLNYHVLSQRPKTPISKVIIALGIIVALYIVLRLFSTSTLATRFPVAQTGMGYGMVFIIGLITSVHCIAMCGGINLSQSMGNIPPGSTEMKTDKNHHSQFLIPHSSFLILPSLLYNAGRLVSYTLVGVIVGAIGSSLTISGRFHGIVLLLAGIFMLIMGLNMLDLFPFLRRFSLSLPDKVSGKGGNNSRLVVGFLNGFMPCGPLQAMQLYALSTGSPLQGGLSMFLFCLGTIPLMFGFGAVSSLLSGVKGHLFTRRVMYVGAIVIAAMGLTMVSNGYSLTGSRNPFATITYEEPDNLPPIQNGKQIVNSTLLPNRYPEITVRQGVPVKWIITAPPGSINGCNNRFLVREYGIEYTFKQGENIIEFTPNKTGTFSYSCWMGMIRSSITVVASKGPLPTAALGEPAGVMIFADSLSVAEVSQGMQTLQILLTDDGFEPPVIVLQRNIETTLTINITSTDPGNACILFPYFQLALQTKLGENFITFIPKEDFGFSTFDYVFFAFAKVVDDLTQIDTEDVLGEAMMFETIVYPDEYTNNFTITY